MSKTIDIEEAKMEEPNTSPEEVWDIDGDGELDETELALKAMDKDGKGTLTKSQMYGLMQSNLKTQRKLTTLRKGVVTLTFFTVLLALANVFTSISTALLAKDTTTDGEGHLIDNKSKQPLSTDTMATVYKVDEELNERIRQRRIQQCEENAATNKANCKSAGNTKYLTVATTKKIMNGCKGGKSVNLQFNLRTVSVCPVAHPYKIKYSLQPSGKENLEIEHELISAVGEKYIESGFRLIHEPCDGQNLQEGCAQNGDGRYTVSDQLIRYPEVDGIAYTVDTLYP